MKKSVLSIVLCLAMILSSMSAMLVMPASAASGMDFLSIGTITGVTDGATVEIVDGVLEFTATAAGQEFSIVFENEASMHDYPYWELTLDSEFPWVGGLYNANDQKWMWSNGDWCYDFAHGDGTANPIGAGAEDVKIKTTGCYTWTGAPLPEYAAVKHCVFVAHGAGKMTISKCAMTDGLDNFSLNTASYTEDMSWNASADLLVKDAAAWTINTDSVNNSNATVEVSGDSVIFGNDNGGWPSAFVNFETPYVVPADSAIYADFTAKQNATVYLFFGTSTADAYNEGEYVGIVPADKYGSWEVATGNYVGTQCLADIVPANCIDEDNNVTINAVSVFATGSAGVCSVVNSLELLYNEAVEIPEGTYITYTMETVTHEGNIAAGEEIALNVTASEVADINGVDLHIAYDDAQFEFVGAEAKGVLAEFGEYVNVNAEREAVDGVKEVWVTAMGLGNETAFDTAADEVILTITLKAKVDITEDAAVSIPYAAVTSNASVINNYALIAEGVNGGVVIEAPAGILGDVNLDEEVDIFDVLRLFKYVGEEIEELEPQALLNADVNLDEEVDIFDVLRLFKFVGEEIEEL